jgi:hypothetical protein
MQFLSGSRRAVWPGALAVPLCTASAKAGDSHQFLAVNVAVVIA